MTSWTQRPSLQDSWRLYEQSEFVLSAVEAARKKGGGARDALRVAVASWATKLGCPTPDVPNVDFLRKWSVDYAVGPDEREYFMTNRDMVILALGIVVAAVGVAWVVKNSREDEPELEPLGPRDSERPVEPAPPSKPLSRDGALVAVVRAGSTGLLQALESQTDLTPDLASQLYRSSEWIWAGSRRQATWLDDLIGGTGTGKGSEYDVHLVEISTPDPGAFARGASSAERLNAFMRLGRDGVRAKVSPRHDKSVVEGRGFFEKG